MMRVAVVGGGIMGAGIAIALLRAGHPVTVVEPDPATAAALRDRLAAESEVSPAAAANVAAELESAASAELVVEAAPEDLALKQGLWRRLGELVPGDTILASNTSSLDVDLLAARVPQPGRVLVTHWFNPAYEIACVEVAPGRATSPAVVERVVALLTAAGKSPVVVPNVAGFIANRIQFAAIREALLCVEEGMDAAAVDEVVRTSFAPRLAALGPLANADLGGLDTYLAIFASLRAAHGERFSAPEVLTRLVAIGRRGTKAGAGVYDYTPESARALARLRDDRLSRIIAAAGGEGPDATRD